MRQKPGTPKPQADRVLKDIRRRTRKHHSAEEKIRIVLEGLRVARERVLPRAGPARDRCRRYAADRQRVHP